ncbi:MAG TPA: PEBP family protein [Anaerolineae bacterium]|nr:PEBP family protein [Anaerolineae bacterium]
MKFFKMIGFCLLLGVLVACGGEGPINDGNGRGASGGGGAPPPPPPFGSNGGGALNEQAAATSGEQTFKLEGWADNWFAVYLGETLLAEDSVPITTERSFNAEVVTFKADYPLQLNFVLKDFKENDTGLEYIGARNQQMGDGGFIMQLTDVGRGEIVAVSDGSWRCLVIHEAPLDKSCEGESAPVAGEGACTFRAEVEPAGWMTAGFDDSGWSSAVVHSFSSVSPKDGYDEIDWDGAAELIWGPDLETDNTVLCRVTVAGP